MRWIVCLLALLWPGVISAQVMEAFGAGNIPNAFPQMDIRGNQYVIAPTNIVADGITSDDLALQQDINACSAVNGSLQLPAGNILLTGAAGTINLGYCHLSGTGVGSLQLGYGGGGTTILLTSTSVVPFTITRNWTLDHINFRWPNQTTGTQVYPALFQSDGVTGVAGVRIDHVTIANAYNAFYQVSGDPGWGDITISDSDMWAVGAVFTLNKVTDTIHMINLHMTEAHACPDGGFPCTSLINAALANNNTAFHAMAGGGVVVHSENMSTFAFHNLILVDSGASWSGNLEGDFDGIGIVVNAAATGANYLPQAVLRGSSVCGIATVGGSSYTGNYPCFQLSPTSSLILDGLQISAQGDLVDSSATGGPIYIMNCPDITYGNLRDGSDYSVLNILTGGPETKIINNKIIGQTGSGLSAHYHGLTAVTGFVGSLTMTENNFVNMNDIINLPTPVSTIIVGNRATGSNSTDVTFTDTLHQIYWFANDFDMPPPVTVSGCGTAPSQAGVLGGEVGVGTGTVNQCTLTFPFQPKFGLDCQANGGNGFTVAGSASGTVSWVFSFYQGTSAYNAAGAQFFYSCRGSM